jgi:lipopolysaccharide assembly outer membrane protein LptD (OstA)
VNSPLIKYIVLLFVCSLTAQTPSNDITPATTPKSKFKTSEIDTSLKYDAKDIDNFVKERKSLFRGDAVVTYKNMTLKAAQIRIDYDANLLTAEGTPDTVWVKKAGSSDSIRVAATKGDPVLVEGGTQMTGAKMVFNYKTDKGLVVRGRTQMEDGQYVGEQIKMVAKKTFNVSHSSFTTCDLDSNPHFRFSARRLKMIVNDRVIAKPIIMYLGNIPVAALPFAFFPTKSGRHSGLIIPRYGESTREGRYLRGLGYYWAASDYWDARATVDFFEKSGWLMDGGVNYALRYKLNGSINGSLTRKNFGDANKERRWDLTVRHNQEIDPNTRFSASGYFVSDKSFYQDLSTNLSARLTRELRSNATFSKYWPQQKLSLSVNATQVRDLQDDVTTTTFPQMTFRKSQTQIFNPKKTKGRRGEDKWYHSLYFSYGSNLYNTRREYLQRIGVEPFKKTDTQRQMNHDFDFSMSSPKKFFGFMSVNQSLNFAEDWFDRTKVYDLNGETNQIESRDDVNFAARHTFGYSASASTKMYGVLAPGIGNIQMIRHVVTPSLSFNYAPDFSQSSWGYFQELTNANGQKVKQDRFGSTPSGGSQIVSLSVRNLFQMKNGVGEKEKKIDVFSMDFNTGFNFKAKQYRLSDLRTYWQANPARNFSLSAGTSHSFYVWDSKTKTRVNQYLLEDNPWQPWSYMRFTSLNLNFSLRLEGKGESKKSKEETKQPMSSETEDDPLRPEDLSVLEETSMRRGNRFDDEGRYEGLHIPWRMNMTFNFNLDKSDPTRTIKRYYMDISGAEMSLTKNWRINYSAHYDLEKRQISYHRFTFYRDLHCWEAQVDWVPSGLSKRVYFRISVKSPTLRDIKLERRGGTGSVLGY